MNYLDELKQKLAERAAGNFPKTPLYEAPSKPSKPPFEGYEGHQGRHVFEIHPPKTGVFQPKEIHSKDVPAFVRAGDQEPINPPAAPFEGFEGDHGGVIFKSDAGRTSAATVAELHRKTRPPRYPAKPSKPADNAARLAERRNILATYEPQHDPNRCHICGHRAEPDRPLLPICTPEPGRHHWLHSTCWPEHVRRIRARLEALMAGSAPT